jgi:amino acid transporter
MKKEYIIPLAWMMGLFVSPEALLLQGGIAGWSGFGFIFPLAAGLALHWLNAAGNRPDKDSAQTPSGEIQLLTDAWGPFAASWLLLMARPVVAVLLATAVLVTSGFVFNEVFLYWFPNFGFAALLLVVILTINLAGPRVAAAAQVMFSGTAIIGLAGLALIGLINLSDAPTNPSPVLSDSSSHSIGLAVMAFVGYDMLRYTHHGLDPPGLTPAVKTALIAGGLLLVLWNTATVFAVAPSRLLNTSIPHILAAKAILGPAGRIVIGVVAIAGSAAAVNYLFQSVARMFAIMAQHQLLPAVFARSISRPVLALSGLAAATGLLMAAGFAGTDLLDVSLRASLMLWLVFYALTNLARHFEELHEPIQENQLSSTRHAIRHFGVAAAMIIVAVIIGATHDSPAVLLKTIFAILGLTGCLAGCGLFFARGFASKPRLQHVKLKKGAKP